MALFFSVRMTGKNRTPHAAMKLKRASDTGFSGKLRLVVVICVTCEQREKRVARKWEARCSSMAMKRAPDTGLLGRLIHGACKW